MKKWIIIAVVALLVYLWYKKSAKSVVSIVSTDPTGKIVTYKVSKGFTVLKEGTVNVTANTGAGIWTLPDGNSLTAAIQNGTTVVLVLTAPGGTVLQTLTVTP